MRRLPFPVQLLVATAVVLLSGPALAQGWSVQTVALRDLRQAHSVVAELRGLGFDAYSEFAMHDGHQFVRVRVGCYTVRAAAQAAASALAGHVTEQAVVVKLAADSKATGCVQEDVGFIKPAVWKQTDSSDGLPTFSVQVAGHQARLVYTGSDWQVIQAGASPAAQPVPATATFESARPGGVPWVAEASSSGPRMLCPGTLLGKAGAAAVVGRAGEVVACRLVPLASELANGAAP